MTIYKSPTFLLTLVSLIFLTSCATLPQHLGENNLLAYTADNDETIIMRHLPVFLIENPNEKHNLIGTPGARIAIESEEDIFIAPQPSSIYTETRKFHTSKGSYTNLIYRIHFEKVPFSLFPFHLGSGKNVGLLVVVTVDSAGRPLLFTTVHTCGCYLTFIPTSYMPEEAFPDDWNKERQSVYHETLPGLLRFKGVSPDQAIIVILIKKDSHRVKDIFVSTANFLDDHKTEKAHIQSLDSLQNLPLKDTGSTSFYENFGYRKGYVKGSFKPWEWLLMSWWTLDWRIGQDKKLGKDTEDSPVFYTSLKPWARDDSDMRVFSSFLEYWGWEL
jgi:hypothetical protein